MSMFDSITKGVNADFTIDKLKTVHESFKGNVAYEAVLADFKTLDWENASFDQVEKVAKRVTKKATGEGLKVGAKFLGEAMLEWGVSIGIASGNPIAGGIVSAIGAALEWGTDMLYERLWPETAVYAPGDIVLVNKTRVAVPKVGGRRRMPTEVMTTGMVVSEAVGEKNEVFDFETGANTWVNRADIKAYPPEKVNAMRIQSASLRNMQDGIKILAEGGEPVSIPHHSVRPGDGVLLDGEYKEIEQAGGGHLLLSGFDGETSLVNVGNKRIADTWQSSSAEVPEGTLVWVPTNDGSYHLSVVVAVLHNSKLRSVSMVTGQEGDFQLWQCVEEMILKARNYSTFVDAVLRQDYDAWMDCLPYKAFGGSTLICRYPNGGPMAPIPEREVYTTDFQMDGFVPWGDYEVDEPESGSGSGMTVALLGVAGILVYLIST
jgi:hypothetical protein